MSGARVPVAALTATAVREQVDALLAGPRPLPIVQAGVPVLRQVATPYEGQLAPPVLAELVRALHETMRGAPGVGLAAPQVGLGLALAVVEDVWPIVDDEVALRRERVPVPFRVLVNPRYGPVGDERVAFYEGCLSVHGWQAVRARWRTVRLTGQDETGRQLDEVLRGWPARIVQHETDHLAGRLYVDDAEMRSLAATDGPVQWAAEPGPEDAAQALGFLLP